MADLDLVFREAREPDLETLVGLLADDPLGKNREAMDLPLDPGYFAAFEAICADPNQELIVAETDEGHVVGMLQLTLIPSLTYIGSWRAQIEGVRVAKAARGEGVGKEMVAFAIQRAKARNCRLVQLTTDKQRPQALKFYLNLGMKATHEGLKLKL